MLKLAGSGRAAQGKAAHDEAADGGGFSRLYRRFAGPVIATRRRALIFMMTVGVATVLACALFYTGTVTIKLLPFDDKCELDVVLKMPEGATLEDTERMLFKIR